MAYKNIIRRIIDKIIEWKEHLKRQALEAPEAPETLKAKLPPKADPAHARAEMFRMYEEEDLKDMEESPEPEPEPVGPQPSEFVKMVWHELSETSAREGAIDTENDLRHESADFGRGKIMEPEAEPEPEVEEVPEPPLPEPSDFVKKVWMTDEVDKILETEERRGKKRLIQRVGIVLVSEDRARKPVKKARKPVAKKPAPKPAPKRKKKAS